MEDRIKYRRLEKMKKKVIKSITIAGFLFSLGPLCFAQSIMGASAKVPTAKGVVVTISKIDSKGTREPNDDVWLGKVDTMDFGKLQYLSKWGISLPKYYFAIDVGLTGGFDPTKTISIECTKNEGPPGAEGGLGDRATITYVKTKKQRRKTKDYILDKKLLKEDKSIQLWEVLGGWLRMYVGVVTKDPEAVPPDPPQSKLFTPADPAGAYTAGIKISYF